MSAKAKLEAHAIRLQDAAKYLLSSDRIKIAALGTLLGKPAVFDRDMARVLTVLWAHDNLHASHLSPDAQPYVLLDKIAEGLLEREFVLPLFTERYQWIKAKSKGTFKNSEGVGGGEVNALDLPLRRIRDTLYEVGIPERGHEMDGFVQKTKMTGKELGDALSALVVSIKKVTTEGGAYFFSPGSNRASSLDRSEFLDTRFDSIAKQINTAAQTAGEANVISLYQMMGRDSVGEDWFAVAKKDLPLLIQAVSAVFPSWSASDADNFKDVSFNFLLGANTAAWSVTVTLPNHLDKSKVEKLVRKAQLKWTHITTEYSGGRYITLRGADKDDLEAAALKLAEYLDGAAGRVKRSTDDKKEEAEALKGISTPSVVQTPEGNLTEARIQLVRLPFGIQDLDSIDALNVTSDHWIGKSLARVDLELVQKTRFSGFVDFDSNYRMMILWANAPNNSEKEEFKSMLMNLLGQHRDKLGVMLKQQPDLIEIPSGAAFYFPKQMSLYTVVKRIRQLVSEIEKINEELSRREKEVDVSRGFNRHIDDSELPVLSEVS